MRTLLPLLSLLLVLPFLDSHAGAGPEDDVVAAAEKAIKEGGWDARIAALGKLEGVTSPKAEKVLLQFLRDTDWAVQIRACEAAGKIGKEASQDALEDLVLLGEIHRVRSAAAQALAGLDAAKAGERLLKAARTAKELSTKARAIEAAGRLGAPDLVGKLREYANHKEVALVAAAARALGWMGRDAAARPKALDLLEDLLGLRDKPREFMAYSAAVEALSRIDDAEARSRLVREVLIVEEDDPYIPTRVARALAAAGLDAASAAWKARLPETKTVVHYRRMARLAGEAKLTSVRDVLEGWLVNPDVRVRSETVRTLGLLGDAASAPALTARLGDEELRVRIEAVTALARTAPRGDFRGLAEQVRKDKSEEVRVRYIADVADQGDAEGIAALQPFLDDPAWRVASAAAASIGTLGIARDLPVLEPLSEARDWRIRAAALEGMARLRALGAIPHLARALEDKDPVVRGVALANLQILTKKKLGTKPDRWLEWHAKEGPNVTLVKRSRRTKEEIEAELKKEQEDEEKARYKHEKDEIEKERALRKRSVEILQKARILVVTGAWDHVEHVLAHLSIPHTLLRAQELKVAGINPNQVILVNCEGNVDKDAQERLRWFVNVGGYLMSTDWALTKTVEPCFPGYVAQFSGSSTGNDVVVVEEARPGHPWTKGIFDDVPALKWWLEVQAFPIAVAYPERCEVIVDSAEMRSRYGSSTMAVEFRYGLGRVQHSISHFFLQEEGMQQTNAVRDRAIFAADHLGMSLTTIRQLVDSGRLAGPLNEATMKEIAPDYSMFRLIVHVVKDKATWVENL